jgi:glycosyltransferase involved in cell wall biosynthesis
MIEAMACGTPVVAFRRGSVPEILEEGLTGCIVRGEDEATAALAEIERFDRRACRQRFERRFSARRMALDYLSAYDRVAQGEEPAPLRSAAA